MMKKIKILLLPALLFMMITPGTAQKLTRYQKNLMYEADIYYVQGDYYYAALLYNELLEATPKNEELVGKLGICYYNLPTYKHEAVKHLEYASANGHTEAMYYLALQRLEEYKFFDVLSLMEQYEKRSNRQRTYSEIEKLKSTARTAAFMVQAPIPVTIKNLGEDVNSSLHDYAPVWDSDGGVLYFTSRRRFDTNSEKDFTEQYDENIYEVDLKFNKLVAKAIPEPLNTRRNDAAVAISFDGQSMILYRSGKDGFSGDLYISKRDGYSWTEPLKLDAEINSKHQEASACFGNKEGTIIYFSSDRPGGFGGKDLYKVMLLPDGSWSMAQNLGEEINTPFDEDGPFISRDGSLYFASKGHESMGGYDIFCSAPDPNLGFKKPVNLGYPINTPSDDVFFITDPSGRTAYFSSDRPGGFGLQDIYEVIFDDANSVIYRGELTTMDDQIPESAFVTVLNEENGIEGLYQTNPQMGTFVLALHSHKKYTVLIEADGYQTIEKAMYFEKPDQGSEIVEEIILSK